MSSITPTSVSAPAPNPTSTSIPTPASQIPSHLGPTASSNHNPFTQDQYAIALAFAKSLPEGRSVEEHLADLQSHIKRGPKASPPSHLEFDAFEYWRDECHKLRQEKRALEERIILAESRAQRNPKPSDRDHILSQESEEDGQDEAQESSRKRRFQDSNLGGHSLLNLNSFHLPSQVDDPTHRLNGHVLKLGRSRKRVETLSKSTSSLCEIDGLANFTCQVVSSLDATLSDCCLAFPLLKVNDGNKRTLDILKQISDQVVLAFLSSFGALNELCRTILGRKERGRLIYRMTMFFENTLDLLHTLSCIQIEHEEFNGKHRTRRKLPRIEEIEYAANRHLGNTLSTIIYNLGWEANQTAHSELLEGVLYVVLQHTGGLVSMTLFNEHVATSKNPGNITEGYDDPAPNTLSKHEMRYVIQVLYNALGGCDKKDLFLNILAAGKKNLGNQIRLKDSGVISVPPGDLLGKARVLLQSTLVKTTLGCDELITLQPQPVPAEDLDVAAGEITGTVYTSEWFLEQVWAMIGWDLVV